MASRKLYRVLAKDLTLFAQPYMREADYRELVRQVGVSLSEDNHKFRMSTWLEACGVER